MAIGPFLLVMSTVFGLVFLFAVFARRAQQAKDSKRKLQLKAFADKHHFVLHPEKPSEGLSLRSFSYDTETVYGSVIADQVFNMLIGIPPFYLEYSKSVTKVATGRVKTGDFYTFDYDYTTGRRSQFHERGVAVFRVPFCFKTLSFRPHQLDDFLLKAVGLEDIQFELEDFNRRYCVQAKDTKFAYDVLHPQMIAFVMKLPPIQWRLEGDLIVLTHYEYWSVDILEELIPTIEHFIELLPEYVRQDTESSSVMRLSNDGD